MKQTKRKMNRHHVHPRGVGVLPQEHPLGPRRILEPLAAAVQAVT